MWIDRELTKQYDGAKGTFIFFMPFEIIANCILHQPYYGDKPIVKHGQYTHEKTLDVRKYKNDFGRFLVDGAYYAHINNLTQVTDKTAVVPVTVGADHIVAGLECNMVAFTRFTITEETWNCIFPNVELFEWNSDDNEKL